MVVCFYCRSLRTTLIRAEIQRFIISKIKTYVETEIWIACSLKLVTELFYAGTVTGGSRCWWRSWLRLCDTNRKVADLIPDGVIGIFHWHNPSGRTIALGLTQPLTEMSTRNISCGVKAAGAYGWQPYHIFQLSWSLGSSTYWNPQGLSRSEMGWLYLFTVTGNPTLACLF
jgi:hypothetical protein